MRDDRPEGTGDMESAGQRSTDQGTQYVQPEPGEESDPTLTNEIPPPTTGEQRYVHDDLGALGSEGGSSWTNQSSTVTSPGATGRANLAGDEGLQEQGGEASPDEAYGQGETREFSALGADKGIEQQEVLQSQPYAREERRAKQRPAQGILGAVGDMFRGLFGKSTRTPDDDQGEAAGEAHP